MGAEAPRRSCSKAGETGGWGGGSAMVATEKALGREGGQKGGRALDVDEKDLVFVVSLPFRYKMDRNGRCGDRYLGIQTQK